MATLAIWSSSPSRRRAAPGRGLRYAPAGADRERRRCQRSDAPGATVSDALNGIGGALATLTTDGVDNASTVPGVTATDALNDLQQQFTDLPSETAGTGLHVVSRSAADDAHPSAAGAGV